MNKKSFITVVRIIITLILCLFSIFSFAQKQHFITGHVSDRTANVKLYNSTIIILNSKDSTLVDFTYSTPEGTFEMNQPVPGQYILMISYPDYADYTEKFLIDSAEKSHDFGIIGLELKYRLLAEVIIKGTKVPIKIRGDTTEFNASSYVIQPNSRVEDLLRQLPGIQVDQDGKITAQGKSVKRVLVDGQEFFGDDPTLVTKNIRGDMVDKVQVYDKKSDLATLTKIDDGQKEKTINIKLKEDKKNGYFGKVTLGLGDQRYYHQQIAFNKFSGNEKFAVYGTLANDGTTNLGFSDSRKYESTDNILENDISDVLVSYADLKDLNLFNGQYTGEGLPTARTAGVHYDNKWKNDRQSINTNYKIGFLAIDGIKNVITQNNIPGSMIQNSSEENFKNSILRQKLDLTYNIEFDKTSSLKLSVFGDKRDLKTSDSYATTGLRNDSLLNKNLRELTNNGEQQMAYVSGTYTRKLKKPGRLISLSLSGTSNKSDIKGNLNSTIDFYDKNGLVDSMEQINQYKRNHITSSVFNSIITYTEPIFKSFALIFNYGVIVNNSRSNQKTFNLSSVTGQYDQFDSSLSNDYQLNQLINRGGLTVNFSEGKTLLNFGTTVADIKYNQVDNYSHTTIERNFLNWSPQIKYQYQYSNLETLTLNYNGSNAQPSIDQIQPLVINTDPLYIIKGNPLLKPTYINRINADYKSYKIVSNKLIGFGGYFAITSNAIVGNSLINTAGKTTLQYVNLNSKHPTQFNGYITYNKKLEKADMNTGLRLNMDGNTYYNIVNGVTNQTRSYVYSGQLLVSKFKQKRYDISASFGPNYTVSSVSLNQSINNNGVGFDANGILNFYLPWKFQFNSEYSYQYRAKTELFDQKFERFLITANLTRTFFKSECLKAVLSCNDILNQNKGFDRHATSSYIIQNTYSTIRRFVMFSLVYDFNKMSGKNPK